MKKALIAPLIFDAEQFHRNAALLVEGEKIVAVVDQSELPDGYVCEHLDTGVLAPGFIDWQVNGGGGVLFNNDISGDALNKIVAGHYLGGTTSMLPTLISDTPDARVKAVSAAQQAINAGQLSILGLHLEGPFFAVEKRGTHNAEFLRAISDDDVQWLSSIPDLSILLTLAPEQCKPGQIKALVEAGILVSAGHTNATSEQIQVALDEGLRGFTHLYNAMRPANSRDPGVVGAALLDQNSWCGIIVDGHHVHPDMVRLAQQAKPSGKLCLVTDAMASVGSDQDWFELYGNVIKEKNGALINAEGSLAGSAISMIDAVRITHQQVGLELSECLRMASLYPAEFLSVDHYLGKFAPDYRADIVHFSDDLQVQQTWVAGQPKIN